MGAGAAARAGLLREALLCAAVGAILLGASMAVARLLQPAPQTTDEVPSEPTGVMQRLPGGVVHRALHRAGVLVDDPTLRATLTGVTGNLLAAADLDGANLKLFVIRLPVANAFVTPGSAIYLTTELFAVLDSPHQLAAVVSHEIGHVVERHAAEALLQNLGLVVIASLGGGDARAANRILEHLLGASLSRAAEREADRYALDLLAQAGIDPAHLGAALEQLGAELPNRSGFSRYVDSHPSIAERAAESRRYADQSRTALSFSATPDWIVAMDWSAVQRAAASIRSGLKYREDSAPTEWSAGG